MHPTLTPPRSQVRATVLLTLLAAVSLAAPASAQSVFINEIHYDNTGADEGEFVEVAGPAGTDLAGWRIEFYNGSNGERYSPNINLEGTIDDEGNGFGALSFERAGIQNETEGLALIGPDDNVVQFLSYEGSFTATNGAASGMTSEDIGVSEQPAPPAGQSLQLKGSGTTYDDFTWTAPTPESPGSVNDEQTFMMDGGGTPGMIVVNTADDEMNADGDCSLREAVEAANTDAAVDACAAGQADGDTITFAASYTIELSMGELPIADDVTIDGSSVDGVTVDANGTSRIFDVDAAAGPGDEQATAFTSLVLREGDSGAGGSDAPDAGGAVDLKAGSEATFTDVDVMDSVAGLNGGGIHAAGGTVMVVTTSEGGTSTVSGNTAGVEGGGLWTAGTLTVSGNTTVDDNEAQGDMADGGGGGLYNEGGTLVVEDGVTVSNNRATGASGSGGGILNNGGTLTVGAATITGNTSNRAGGGIEDAGGTFTVTGATVTGNDAGTAPGNGGGLHSGGGDGDVIGGTFSGNTAVEGGGLWSSGTLDVSGGTLIDGNVAVSDADEAFEGGGGVFNQAGTVTLDGVTVSNNTATGPAGSGGGVFNNGAGTLAISNSAINGNESARAGGGLEANGGTVTLTDVDFADNTTGATPGNGGALHVTAGNVTATGGTVSGNTAASEGGGFWNNAGWTMTVDGTTFTNNTASGAAADNGGGGLFNNGGTLLVTDATVTSNAASGMSGSGGGLFNGPGGTLTVTGGLVQFNTANRAGGGIEDAGGTVTLTEVTVNANAIADAMPGNGGGLHSGGGTVTIVGGEYTRNSAVEGGGLWTNSVLDIQPAEDGTPALISINTATGDAANNGGGGIYAESGAVVTSNRATIGSNAATGTSGSGGGVLVADSASVTLTLGVVTLNRANRAGAGIEVADDAATAAATSLVLDRVEVSENTIDEAAPGNGGGLHVGGVGSATVTQSTFSNNSATEGGGLWISAGGVLDLSLSTVSNNAAFGDGAGVYDDGPGGTISLSSVTVAENTAVGGSGGGLLSQSADGASFTFMNTIVGRNVATAGGNDCSGTFTSGDFNLIQDTSGCTINGETDNNVTGQDPQLGPLADNGGPTDTRALQAGSPAIDAGMTALAIDQRGFARIDGADDIGAFEFGAEDNGLIACTVGSPLSFDFDGDGNGRGSNVMADDFNSTGTDATFGEFVGIRNEDADGDAIALATCSFVVFDPFDEDITFSLQTTGTVAPDESYVLATMNGDQAFGQPDVLTDSPGAFALVQGMAAVGADFQTVLPQIVAAVVYDRNRNVFGSIGGGATEEDRAAFAAALAEITEGSTAVDDAPTALAVTVAPNPISGTGQVTWALPAATDVRVTLYDALGRQVAILAEGPYGIGQHAADLSASALPAGVYVVHAVLGAESRTTRVTVVR